MSFTEENKQTFPILVVDDNDNNIFTLTRRLQKEGYNNFQIARNGTEALEKIAVEKFDLVLLDLQMPDVNGYEVLKRIKTEKTTQDIMVLMISGDDSIENITECIRMGAEDFLPKPFNVEILNARVGSCLKKSRYKAQEKIYTDKIEFEKRQYRSLLEATFPKQIIETLKENKQVEPSLYPRTAVLFIDLAGFTDYCALHEPKEIFDNLQDYVNLCEKLCEKYNLEKIKTIGDAFMATGGMFTDVGNPVLNTVNFALELLASRDSFKVPWGFHVGIDYGDVIGGIVGKSKYLFDVWGDTVNTAARIQGAAGPNNIYVSEEALTSIKELCQYRSLGKIDLKGKGAIELFQILSVN